MFTVDQRDAVRDRVLALAESDGRIVAGAAVGSLALGGGDRFSDLDLTFAVADGVAVGDVLDDWTGTLSGLLGAVRLVDLERGPTTYRVFLLNDLLQLDLSMTPAARFTPAGPRFRLLFGQLAAPEPGPSSAPPVAADILGWGVIYALHSRSCIERGRAWQAEHYVGAVRDHALTLACVRHGLQATQARGYDDLPAEVLAQFADTRVTSLEPELLRSALSAAARALLREARQTGVRDVEEIARRATELV